MEYDVIIGLEVHAELKTESKCFCSCKNEPNIKPNSNCCPVCVGLPGALPVLNKKAVEQTIKAGLALGFKINNTAIFEIKNYFYPDLSKAYQISQYEKPICKNGYLKIGKKKLPINRIHLEEDAGKLIHQEALTLVDYNRGGVPLIELVTDALKEPHMETADEAIQFLEKLRQVYIYAGVSDCEVEKGQMRADINVSLKPKGSQQFGTRVEMKNIMGFKAVYRAINYEIERQKDILDNGGIVLQETRRWDDEHGESYVLRSKENAEDYRYFADPDLLAVNISDEQIERIRKTLPVLPHQLKEIYTDEYGLSDYDSDVILANKEISEFYNECVKLYNQPKVIANWIITEVMARVKISNKIEINKENLIWIIKAVEDKKLQRNMAKDLLSLIWGKNINAESEAKKRGMLSNISSDFVFNILDKIIAANANVLEQYKKEQDPKILNFLVGQVMKETKGKANAQEVMEKIKEKIK